MPLGSSSDAPVIRPGPRTSLSLGLLDGSIAAAPLPMDANRRAAALFEVNAGNIAALLRRASAESGKLEAGYASTQPSPVDGRGVVPVTGTGPRNPADGWDRCNT